MVPGIIATSRRALDAVWQLCATAPDAAGDPAALDAIHPEWRQIGGASTVAHALRMRREWSLDDPPQNLDEHDWWFRAKFEVAAESRESLILGLDGLATHAQVWLNGSLILRSANMFVAHEIKIATAVQQTNELSICCRSITHALKAKRPRPRWKAPMVDHQQLRWHRTTLLGRTAGWSPPCAAIGPWRPIWLQNRAADDLSHLRARTRFKDGVGCVEVIDTNASNGTSTARLKVSRNGHSFESPLEISGQGCAALVEIAHPDLWWPHSHGEPALYDVSIEQNSENHSLGKVGFRSINIVESSQSFELHVNGERVFCRGACWTPIDPVSLSATPDEYAAVLETVQFAGMNMVRVCGPMVYECEAFFAACDRLGILVWQDFMFANMDYPAHDADFAASVAVEIKQQLSQWSSHPSVAVICGNSEVEQQAAMFGAGKALWSPPLFHEVIPELVENCGIQAPYWPSSAHGGAFPHQPNTGTTSYYGVGAYLLPLEDARRSNVRFATEALAFANVPEDSSLQAMPGGLDLRAHHPGWKSRVPRDLGAGWDFDDVRDFYLGRLFDVDPLKLRYSDHSRYLELGRIVSGEVISAAFSEWRRAGSTCGGALIWFLKDLWHGAGWGLLDADGRPKAALHCARNSFRSRGVLLTDDGCNGLTVHLVNDLPTVWEGTLRLLLLRSGVVPTEIRRMMSVSPRSTVAISLIELLGHFADLNDSYRFGPAAYDVICAELDLETNGLSRAWHFPRGRNLVIADDIGLICSWAAAGHEYILTLNASSFAQHVTIELDHFVSKDQYFHLLPGEQRTIAIRALRAGVEPSGFVRAINSRATTRIKAAS